MKAKNLIAPCCFYFAAYLLSMMRAAEVPLQLSSLTYDPYTQKLYGTATNDLLQIDPDSGQVVRSFAIGTNLTRVVPGAEHGLWLALAGERAIRRFDLESLSAEDKIHVPGGPILDIGPSPTDPYTLAVSTALEGQSGSWPATWGVQDGVVLSGSASPYLSSGYLVMQGSFIYENLGFPVKMLLDQNGVSYLGGWALPPGSQAGHIQLQGNRLYLPGGAVFDTDTGAQIMNFTPAVPGTSTFAINNQINSIFFLSLSASGFILDRFDLSTGELTGRQYFSETADSLLQSAAIDLTTWSTNRIAFYDRTNLYLLQTEKLFAPPDVVVTQTASPSPAPFAGLITLNINVTNKGPGAALDVIITNSVSSGIILGTTALGPNRTQAKIDLGSLAPKSGTTVTLSVLVGRPGIFTNRAQLTVDGDLDTANNQSDITIPVSFDRASIVTALPTPAQDITFDNATQKLFVLQFFFDAGAPGVWRVDPSVPAIDFALSLGVVSLWSTRTGGVFYAYYQENCNSLPCGEQIFRINTQTMAIEVALAPFLVTRPSVGGTLIDFDSSPTDEGLLAIADENGTRLFKNGVLLPNSLPQGGNLGFSEDGSKLIFVNPSTCGLEIYAVDQQGLTLERAGDSASCSRFRVMNNLIYFNSGAIYDAATGQKSTNSIKLPPASLVLPRTSGQVDILFKTNGNWTVSRLEKGTVRQIRAVQVPGVQGSPLKITEAGADSVAVLTTASSVLLVNLENPKVLNAAVSLSLPDQPLLSFDSTAGSIYQVERSLTINPPAWSAVITNIQGSGSIVKQPLSTTGGSAAFYRVVKLP